MWITLVWLVWPPITPHIHTQCRGGGKRWFLKANGNTVKPVNKGHSREPENVPFVTICPLFIG